LEASFKGGESWTSGCRDEEAEEEEAAAAQIFHTVYS
jgi:hypothetical protein